MITIGKVRYLELKMMGLSIQDDAPEYIEDVLEVCTALIAELHPPDRHALAESVAELEEQEEELEAAIDSMSDEIAALDKALEAKAAILQQLHVLSEQQAAQILQDAGVEHGASA